MLTIKTNFLFSPDMYLKQISCPFCGLLDDEYSGDDFYTCDRCGCLYGVGSLEESYTYVLPVISDELECLRRSTLFVLRCTTTDRGSVIRTGLYDPDTLMITQIGLAPLYGKF